MHTSRHDKRISSTSLYQALLGLLLFLPGAVFSQESGAGTESLEDVVARIKEQYAPDTRVEVFKIEVRDYGDHFMISGELANKDIKTALWNALKAEAGSKALIDSVKMLPMDVLQPEIYGIVRISVANLRHQPSMKTELVSQTLLGTVVKILKEEDGFYYVQNWDQYLGWISKSSVIRADSKTAENWKHSPRVVVTAVYGVVRKERNETAEILTDLVPGVVLRKIDRKGKWIWVRLPDGREGYVKTDAVMDEAALESIQATEERVIAVARGYLGIPYLWAGISTKGLDCSGFVQTVYRMNNLKLPRDANQMVKVGKPVEFGEDYEDLKVGDLLFFGPEPEKITHVGLYMGDKLLINSSNSLGYVHINSLDPEHPLYNEHRRRSLRAARRHIAD